MERVLRSDEIEAVEIVNAGSAAGEYDFDVTPARLVTGLTAERRICAASEEGRGCFRKDSGVRK